jgi:hypothetical protein
LLGAAAPAAAIVAVAPATALAERAEVVLELQTFEAVNWTIG